MNTITSSYAVSKGNTPAFKGTVDKSVYRFARKLEKSLTKEIRQFQRKDKLHNYTPDFIRRSLSMTALLARLKKFVAPLDKNTVIKISKEPVEGLSKFEPPRKGLFLSISNSLVAGERIGKYTHEVDLSGSIMPDTASLIWSHFDSAVKAITGINQPDKTLFLKGSLSLQARAAATKNSPFAFIKNIFLKRDIANFMEFKKANNMNDTVFIFNRDCIK